MTTPAMVPAITFDEFWNWSAAAEMLPEILTAFVKVTLLVTVVGTVIATIVGLLLAVLTQATPRLVSGPVRWVMDVVRMTPLIVQLMFASFLVPVSWNLMWVGTVVIGLHYATYMAESFIAGIASVDKGQWEASRALSLPQGRTWRAVVLPQALRATLPSLGNWAISMFKDTPYLFAITVLEMVTVAQQAGDRTFRYNEAFTIAGLVFLVASLVTAFAVRRLEKALVY
ncbi:amino acid ABC transporter permease [Janibacter anophelis]|uniref:amino acid ABC transporter permease n=1 Tax=Janibacter anophelis TaxID=319054 RepID=UPI0030B828B5